MDVDTARIRLGALVGDPRLVIVTGKGGTGKTTVSLLVGLLAERAGLRPLVVHVDDAPRQHPEVRAVTLRPEAVMLEYLETHGFGALAGRLVQAGVLDAVATAIPGIRDLLLLAKVKQLVNAATLDLVILDAPASGHALSLLSSPEGLADIASDGPIAQQSAEVIELLGDHDTTGALVVTIPEETPIAETRELLEALPTRADINVLSVVVNQMPLAPPAGSARPGSREATAASYLRQRWALAQTQLEGARDVLGARSFVLPHLDLVPHGHFLDALADHLEQVEP
ncbi:Anion-transporting ATPase [Acidimicrobium ferrooxidans DSM 10331]|uniref:Anion-transporting ATPase n=1 Tax=Acidimicrobium ferrooxidans (strain DSM 10331 / JCM 15462 / NBRC 103882 / ICP) TaxID=525909 RepID=C7M2G3_ACIFD|nr:ArsA-related P-loop ATPase [Acidimicrobium ferrooxidans]ACU53207.1 Anion-transporting ATPase [Acidimicrobium ferrooxidans DSM 10331]